MTMHLLLMAYSEIAQRRAIPALSSLGVAQLDIASQSRVRDVEVPNGMSVRVFEDYETALDESQADVVYVSTRTGLHAEWADKALRRGFHVIVDKPAFTCLADATRLVALAQQHHRCLAEAIVYAYHPQIQMAKDVFTNLNCEPTQLIATFSFPPLARDNFRYHRAYGGGALWDLGPYAVTPGRLFFGSKPCDVVCRVTAQGEEVETAFSVLITYEGGQSLVGHFGYHTGYQNRLELLGPHTTVHIDRVFSTPAHMENFLHVRQHDQTELRTVPPTDHFACFFREVFRAIETGEHDPFAKRLLADAVVLDQLRQSGGKV